MVAKPVDPEIPSTSQINNIEVVNVTKDNFNNLWPEILVHLRNCSYLAIDLELSGLGDLKQMRSKNINERYSAYREAAMSRSILSFGLAFFQFENKNERYRCLEFSSRVFNILTLCSDPFTIEPDALKFLAKHSFDFNKLISSGVSYCVSTTKAACSIRSLLTEIFASGKPLLFHNGLIDIIFLYHHFYSPLPENWGTLCNALADIFTEDAPLCDSKYLTEFEYRTTATFLEHVFRKSQRDNCREAMDGRFHLKLSFPICQSHKNSEKVDCSLPENFPHHSIPSNIADLVCSSFSNHGFCHKNVKSVCEKSHDVDFALDLEWIKKEKEKLKKKRKHDHLKPESIRQKELKELKKRAPNLQDNVTLPDVPRIAVTGCHRAGIDAFMTGFTILFNERLHLWRSGKIESSHLNRIPLSGKSTPLIIQSTHSAPICETHEARFAEIRSRRSKLQSL